MPLFVRRARSYLRVRSICKRGKNTRLKRLFEARGRGGQNIASACLPICIARGRCYIVWLHIVLFAAKCTLNIWRATRRLAFIYPLCAFFVSLSFNSLFPGFPFPFLFLLAFLLSFPSLFLLSLLSYLSTFLPTYLLTYFALRLYHIYI